VESLRQSDELSFAVQSSARRAFEDRDYEAVGADIVDDLTGCSIVMGVKEIPPALLQPHRTYCYFSHTIKGQPANMPALARHLELGCTLIDYERIVDEYDRRLVCFGRFAGLAGMVDSLWALGQRLSAEGLASPFERVQPCHRYEDLRHARRDFSEIAALIEQGGIPQALAPCVFGFTGYGRVSLGAQEIIDWLPVEEVAPEELASLPPDRHRCFKTVFKKEHIARPVDTAERFDLHAYTTTPHLYESGLDRYIEQVAVLINGIYWEPGYPQLLTRDHLSALYGAGSAPRLRVIGDITCDIDGPLACTVRPTTPDSPVYVYDPVDGSTEDGVNGCGPVVLAVDFLPCELPVDASRAFGDALMRFVPALAAYDHDQPFDSCGLPDELKRATICHRGQLTPAYAHLEQALRAVT
jgi:alpha-aminoadipic semialdehyde synthase